MFGFDVSINLGSSVTASVAKRFTMRFASSGFLLSAEIGGDFAPLLGIPFDDGIGIDVSM